MQPSMEARWFWPCQIPPAVQNWWMEQNYQSPTHALPTEQSRTDWYLRLPQNTDLSIKLREGQIEVKQQICDRGLQLIAPSVQGQVGQWTKWSFPLAEATTTIQQRLDQKEQWIAVEKKRQSQTYYLVEDKATGNDREMVSESAIATKSSGRAFEQLNKAGCRVEIADITAQEQRWFSLGIEAFGSIDTVASVFDQICPSIFAYDKSDKLAAKLVLEAAHSLSYPQWLATLPSIQTAAV